jgi:hypothetical protein
MFKKLYHLFLYLINTYRMEPNKNCRLPFLESIALERCAECWGGSAVSAQAGPSSASSVCASLKPGAGNARDRHHSVSASPPPPAEHTITNDPGAKQNFKYIILLFSISRMAFLLFMSFLYPTKLLTATLLYKIYNFMDPAV